MQLRHRTRAIRISRSDRSALRANSRAGCGGGWSRYRRARFEALETRQLLSAVPIVVTSLADQLDVSVKTATCRNVPALMADGAVDAITLRDAVAIANNTAAANGGAGQFTITLTPILSLPASIDLTSTLTVSSQITIQGPWATDGGLTIDLASGAPAARLFTVTAAGGLTLQSLTLSGGSAVGTGAAGCGGAVYNQGTLNLVDCTLSGNMAAGGSGGAGLGGAVFNDGGTITLINSTLADNSALDGNGGSGSSGGALYSSGGSLTISSCTIANNQADQAGGVFSAAALTLNNTIVANSTTSSGTAASDVIVASGGTSCSRQ